MIKRLVLGIIAIGGTNNTIAKPKIETFFELTMKSGSSTV
jgi:hypothetical protein